MTEQEFQKFFKHIKPAYMKYLTTYVDTLSMNEAWAAYVEEVKKKKPEYSPNRTYKYAVHKKVWPAICHLLEKSKAMPTKSWIIEKWMKIAEEPDNRGEEMAALRELAKLIEAVDDQMKIQLQVPEKIEIHFTDEADTEEKI